MVRVRIRLGKETVEEAKRRAAGLLHLPSYSRGKQLVP